MFMSLYLDQLVLTCTEDELVELTLETELRPRVRTDPEPGRHSQSVGGA